MEIIIEIIIEVFGEAIMEGLIYLISRFSDKINTDTNAKKILKYTISGIFFVLALILLVLALIYKTGIYVLAASAYFLLLAITYIVRFINNNIFKSELLGKLNTIINRIIHYAFPIILIVLAINNKNQATAYIITLSVIALFVYLCINVYRISYYNKKSTPSSFTKRLNSLLKSYYNKPSENKKYQVESLIKYYPEYTKAYIKNIKDNKIKKMLSNIVLDSMAITQDVKDLFLDEYNY